MADTEPNESELEVPAEDLDEFIASCAEEGLEVETEGEIVRDIITDATNIVTLGPVVYETAKFAVVRVKGSRTGIARVDRLFDRKAGAHVIFTNEKSQLADTRDKERPYGLVRVVEPREELDIDAKGSIVDRATRLEFVERVKRALHNDGLKLGELREEVSTWDGVERADLFRRGAQQRVRND